jgi:glucokinase
VVICGGIIPKLLELFSESPFYDKFTYNKPKYTTLLRNVPIYISKDPYAGLKGCQQALHNKFLKSEINRFSYD